jgi:hypothetical protein
MDYSFRRSHRHEREVAPLGAVHRPRPLSRTRTPQLVVPSTVEGHGLTVARTQIGSRLDDDEPRPVGHDGVLSAVGPALGELHPPLEQPRHLSQECLARAGGESVAERAPLELAEAWRCALDRSDRCPAAEGPRRGAARRRLTGGLVPRGEVPPASGRRAFRSVHLPLNPRSCRRCRITRGKASWPVSPWLPPSHHRAGASRDLGSHCGT